MRIAIIENDGLAREATSYFMAEKFGWCVDTFSDLYQFMPQLAGAGDPPIWEAVIVCPKAYGFNKPWGLKRLVDAAAPMPVIVLTDRATIEAERIALKAGAAGIISKHVLPAVLAALTARAAAGETVTLKTPTEALKRPPLRPKDFVGTITARQLDVIRLAAQDLRNCEIAEQMGVSENTVKTHMKGAREKFGVNSKTGLVRMAGEMGLLA